MSVLNLKEKGAAMSRIIEHFTGPVLFLLELLGLMPTPSDNANYLVKLMKGLSRILALLQSCTLIFHCYDYISDQVPKFTHFSSYILLIVFVTEAVTLPIAVYLLRNTGAPVRSLLNQLSEKYSTILTPKDNVLIVVFSLIWALLCVGPKVYYFLDDLYQYLEADLQQFRSKYRSPISDSSARWLVVWFDLFWSFGVFSKEVIQFLIVQTVLILAVLFRRITSNLKFVLNIQGTDSLDMIQQTRDEHEYLSERVRDFDKLLSTINFIRCMELYGLCLSSGYQISGRFNEAAGAGSDRTAILAGMELIQYGMLLLLHVGAMVFLLEQSQSIRNVLEGETRKDRKLKEYLKLVREEPVSITMGGVIFNRESAIATAGSTLGYILIFSELADSGNDFDKKAFLEKLRTFVKNNSIPYPRPDTSLSK